MAKPFMSTDKPQPAAEEKPSTLKGTLASVLLLALFIVAVWGGIFGLYMSRL